MIVGVPTEQSGTLIHLALISMLSRIVVDLFLILVGANAKIL